MAGEQNFKVFLSFKDEATGKFIKATEEQIASMKKLGLTVKKEGAGVGIDLNKMAQSHEKAGRASRFHRTAITELQGSIGSLRNVLLLYFFAMRPIMNLYKQTTEAAIAQENAETRLAAAFSATGRGSQQSVKNIIEQASALQNLTGYADDQIIASSAILATYKLNETQIKKVIPTLLDMTSALKAGGDSSANLEAIAKRLGLAFTGQATFLKRYGIVIDEATAKHGSFDQILKAIIKSVKGVSEAMGKTFAGQVNILKAAISDFNEQLGFIIIKSPVVIASLQLISEAIREQTTNVEKSREATNNFLETWKNVAAGIIGVVESVKYLWRAFLQGLKAIEIVIAKIVEWFSMLIIKIAEAGKFLANLTPWTKHFAEGFQQVINETTIWRDVAKGTAEGIASDFAITADAMNNTIGGIVDQYAKVEAGANNVIKAQKEGFTNLKAIVEDTSDTLGNTFNVMTTLMTSYATGMRDALSEGFIKLVKGDFEGLKDVIVSFGDMMLKTISEIIANLIIMTIWKQAAGFLGFSGGYSFGPSGLAGHTGGYVLSPLNSFGYGKKFHSGGEVPATLLEGEGVLNTTGMRSLGVDNLNKLNRGEQVSGGQTINNYYIQTIDERSFRERLQQHGDIYTNASERGIADNTSLRKTTQRWGS